MKDLSSGKIARQAQTELSIATHVYTTTGDADYQPKLQHCADDGHALCLGVSFLRHDPILAVAASMTSTKFAGSDTSFETAPANLRGIDFAEDQAGYLAGVPAGTIDVNDDCRLVYLYLPLIKK